MYPSTGMTKAEVMNYLVQVAPAILHPAQGPARDPIRWPGGVGGEKFFERTPPRGAPDWIRRQTLRAAPGAEDEGAELELPFLDDLAGLVWAANQGALELHTPQWRVGPRGKIHRPDRLVVDLDPGAPRRAGRVRGGRAPGGGPPAPGRPGDHRPVTSGSKGMQLYAPLPGTQTVMESAVRPRHRLRDRRRPLVAGGRDHEEGHPRRQGAHRLVAEPPGQDDDHAVLAAGSGGPARRSAAVVDEIGPGLEQLGPDEVVARYAERGDPFA